MCCSIYIYLVFLKLVLRGMVHLTQLLKYFHLIDHKVGNPFRFSSMYTTTTTNPSLDLVNGALSYATTLESHC